MMQEGMLLWAVAFFFCSIEKTSKPCKPLLANYFQLLEPVLQLLVSGNNSISYLAILEESVILEFDFSSKSLRTFIISVEPQT